MPTFHAPATNNSVSFAIISPSTTGAGDGHYDLSALSPAWTITAVSAVYVEHYFDNSTTQNGVFAVADAFGSASVSAGGSGGAGNVVNVDWNASGISWVVANAGIPDADSGAVSGNLTPGSDATAWSLRFFFDFLSITYLGC